MTTPDMNDVPLPYSVVFVPTAGAYNPLIPVKMRNDSRSNRLALHPGVSIIQVAWDGEEELIFNHWREGKSPSIVAIPSATAGTQRTAVVTVSHETVTSISCTIGTPTADSESVLSGRRIAVTVIPFPTPTETL